MNQQEINVIGTGYIGSLISIYLSRKGYHVTALDKEKDILNKRKWFKRYCDIEAELTNELENINTITSYDELEASTSVICVNTPEGEKSADLSNLKNAIRDLADKIETEHTIILRSTVPPKTTKEELIPILEERSGLNCGEELHLCYAPEFVRGGTGLKEFTDPSKTVISGDELGKQAFRKIFPVSDNLHDTSIGTAEAVKYFDNIFHGLKISLANECGRLGQEIGIKPEEVMQIISSDYRLNVSDMYMKPGKSFGGPCLYKDIKAMNDEAERHNTNTPVISSINESNDEHNSWIVEKIKDRSPSSLGIIGAKYKKDFNSVARSPSLEIASMLEGDVDNVLVYDPDIDVEGYKQVGSNEIKDADMWVVFNKVEHIQEMKSDFSNDIIDLAAFNF